MGDTDFRDQVIKAEDLIGYDGGDKLIFIGHYGVSPKNGPSLLANNVAYLDYSMTKGGMLVAYRWSGEQKSDDKNIVH